MSLGMNSAMTPWSPPRYSTLPLGLPLIAFLPSPFTRREWAKQQKIDLSLGLPPPQPYAFCKTCQVAIGLDCHEEEVWLQLTLISKKPVVAILCGTCADELKLAFGLRVVDQRTMQTLRGNKYQLAAIIALKRKEMTREYWRDHAIAQPA